MVGFVSMHESKHLNFYPNCSSGRRESPESIAEARNKWENFLRTQQQNISRADGDSSSQFLSTTTKPSTPSTDSSQQEEGSEEATNTDDEEENEDDLEEEENDHYDNLSSSKGNNSLIRLPQLLNPPRE